MNSVIRSLSLSLSCVWFCMYTSDDLYIVYTCMFTLYIFIFWYQIIWFEGINWTLTWYIIFCKKNNLKKENHKILEILTFTGWSLQSGTWSKPEGIFDRVDHVSTIMITPIKVKEWFLFFIFTFFIVHRIETISILYIAFIMPNKPLSLKCYM